MIGVLVERIILYAYENGNGFLGGEHGFTYEGRVKRSYVEWAEC